MQWKHSFNNGYNKKIKAENIMMNPFAYRNMSEGLAPAAEVEENNTNEFN